MERLVILLVSVLLLCTANLACGGSLRVPAARHVDLHSIPSTYQALSKAEDGMPITLTFALRHENAEELERLFWEVSDPKHPQYGKFLTIEQIADIVAPSRVHVGAVLDWLRASDIHETPRVARSRDLIQVRTTVARAQKLLNTEIRLFKHRETAKLILRATSPITIPEEMRKHIDFVGGLSRFPNFKKIHMSPFFDSKKPYDRPAVVGAGNAPDVMGGLPGNAQVAIIIKPKCKDGSLPAVDNPTHPCQSTAAPITAINVILKPTNFGQYTASVPIADAVCYVSSGSVLCRASVDTPTSYNYAPTTVSAQVVFSDGSLSEVVTVPSPAFMSQFTSPSVLASYYGTNFQRGSNPNNKQALAEFLGEFYSQKDSDAFMDMMGLPRMNISKIVGNAGNNESNPGGEATLDVQYIMGVAINVSTEFWSFAGGSPDMEPYMDWLMAMSDVPDDEVPKVHSISYGDSESVWPKDEAERINSEFKKAGLRGISLLFSSGDDGVGDNYAREDPKWCTPFSPSFPASSPYITSIGGTQFSTYATPQCSVLGDARATGLRYSCNEVLEIACSSDTGGVITTGGGFSNYFSQPSYQSDVVTQFLNTSKQLPPGDLFNRTGRAYPDISGLAHNYIMVLDGHTVPVHGTSASAPLLAAMIALINDERMNRGVPAMGFLNPWLYQIARDHPDVYYDITMGNNKCTAKYWPEKPFCCDHGFYATTGFDPVTGLGTPRYQRLRALVHAQIHEETAASTVSTLLFWVTTLVLALAIALVAAGVGGVFAYFKYFAPQSADRSGYRQVN